MLSCLGMREMAGWVGLVLPFAVLLGNLPHALEGSISAYFFARFGRWFVGSPSVIGFFMVSARGYDKRDERAGRLAGVFSLGVALIPMNYCDVRSGWVMYRGWLHWTCATLLFIVLARMCLKLFIKTDAPKPAPTKLLLNKFYVVSGRAILVGITPLGAHSLFTHFPP